LTRLGLQPVDGAYLAIGTLALVSLGAAIAHAGSRSKEPSVVTTLTGDEVFGHVTTPGASRSILRQGFRGSLGRHGSGVYLLPPEEPWGDGLPPGSTPAHGFRLRRHPDTELRVLRVRLPAGTRLLRVAPPNVTLEAFKLLSDWGAYKAALSRRPPWEDSDVSHDFILRELLGQHQIDGLYVYDFVFDQDEILVIDPRKVEVIREQVHRGA